MSNEQIELAKNIIYVIVVCSTFVYVVNWRLKQIEKRLDEHNNYAKKFGEIAIAIKEIQKDIDYFKNTNMKGE